MYKLQLKTTFPHDSRQRAGIRLAKGEPVEIDLTDEQVKTLRADQWITVSKVESDNEQKPKQQPTYTRKMVDKQKKKA